MSARLAVGVVDGLVSLLLAVGDAALLAAGRRRHRDQRAAFDVVLAVALLTYPTVGAVVASRRPENAIGWLFCARGHPVRRLELSYAYATYALVTAPGSLPGGIAAAWLSSWLGLPALFGVPALLFLLFPDGRLLGRALAPAPCG